MKTLRLLLPLVGCLLLTACTAGQITSTLEAAVDAAIAADSIARPQDAPILAIVTSCLDQAETELAGTSTPAIKATAIAADCAAAVSAARSSTTLAAVSAALSTFLRTVASTSAEIQFTHPEMVNAFAGSSGEKLSAKALKHIRAKIERLKHEKSNKGKKEN